MTWGVLLLILVFPAFAVAEDAIPRELQGIGIEEHLGAALPLDLPFTDEDGTTVPLRQYIGAGEKPTLVALMYNGCPSLCGLLMNGVVKVFKAFSWTVGTDFNFVAVSIDPTETPDLAREKKAALLAEYGRPTTPTGWRHLVGTETSIRALADVVGFRYRYDDDQQQYAHAAAIYAVTPDGRLSRYLYGIDFRPLDLKLALMEADGGKIGTTLDHLLLFCYRYDPKGKKYALFATRLMRAGAGATVVLLGASLWTLSRRRRAAGVCS
ncbi:MAG: SCO family protein [Deltaproteobacteria bacterium]|nr:SCO family protein [Deltaproteobacteria bacterium]